MRLRHIELFHAVLTTGSLTGAARLLNISQPAASKVLQHAELQLGYALFSRVRGRLQPTSEALLLRHRVERVVHELHGLQRLTANIGRPESYPLRVTCTPTLAQALVPDATTLLRKAFPGTTAELFTQHSAEMCESLMLHEADIGLTLQDAGHQGLHQEPLCHGHVMVIAPPGWWSAAELTQPLPVTALPGGHGATGVPARQQPRMRRDVQSVRAACRRFYDPVKGVRGTPIENPYPTDGLHGSTAALAQCSHRLSAAHGEKSSCACLSGFPWVPCWHSLSPAPTRPPMRTARQTMPVRQASRSTRRIPRRS